jgi:hypothetical protein
MKNDYLIPIKIQCQLIERTTMFSNQYLTQSKCRYICDARGKFIYLMRIWVDGSIERIGRLTYNGDTEKMSFAIFKYSTEKYDSSASFPGNHLLDGTIEGAMKAGLKAYPV